MRILAPVIAALLVTMLPAATPQAARVSVVEGEGAPDCLLELGGPDKFNIMAHQGGGLTTWVRIRFYAMLDVFPLKKELRLAIMKTPDTPPEVFIGGVSELDMAPTFSASLAFLPWVVPRSSFTYVLDGRPAVTLESPTQGDVDAFTACVMGH